MKTINWKRKIQRQFLLLLLLPLALLLASSMATYGHGPKGHASGDFTPLMALKKSIGMYDRLVSQGKLPEGWETDLQRVDVSERTKGKAKELVVAFTRNQGEPKSVFIFFSAKGEYKGSNFTGK